MLAKHPLSASVLGVLRTGQQHLPKYSEFTIACGELFSVLLGIRKVSYRRAPYWFLFSQLQSCLALIIVAGALTLLPVLSQAQSTGSPLQGLTVIGQGPLSAYGAPEAFSRSRFGTLTQAYVLQSYPRGVIYGSDNHD
jgi:hypothetical protein